MSGNGPEDFLSRWVRLKRQAADPVKPQSDETAPSTDAEASRGDAGTPGAPVPVADTAAELPELPTIESITSTTDIRGFLAPGVPAELTRDALRRAWSADPAIRDFIGLAENQWDFTAPNAIPGFGPLSPFDDVAKMVERIFGHTAPEPPAEAVADPAGNQQNPLPKSDAVVDDGPTGRAEDRPLDQFKNVTTQARVENTALQHDADNQQTIEVTDRPIRRRHGGALPH